jgi:hypothetical protein
MNPEKIKRRIASLTESELMDWANLAVSGMMRHLDDHRRSPDEAHLAEISLAAAAMGYVCDSLAERHKARQGKERLDSDSHAE